MSIGLVKVVGLKDKAPKGFDLDICPVSRDDDWWSLSPFYLGPCRTPSGIMFHNMENMWQYSKVYEEHLVNSNDLFHGEVSAEWWAWHLKGSTTEQAHRYPAGKGRKALFSKWGDLRLSYIPARKQIYVPEYAKLVIQKPKFKRLLKDYKKGAKIVLRDYDTYDIQKAYPDSRSPWLSAIQNENAKFGHAFVIALALMFHERPLWYNQWVI